MPTTDARVSDRKKVGTRRFPRLVAACPFPYRLWKPRGQTNFPMAMTGNSNQSGMGSVVWLFRNGQTSPCNPNPGQPLTRYFPEFVQAFQALPSRAFVLDGEIVVAQDGRLSFDALLLRIHPAASRVAKLAHETPATFIAFDLLEDSAKKSIWSISRSSNGGHILNSSFLPFRIIHRFNYLRPAGIGRSRLDGLRIWAHMDSMG